MKITIPSILGLTATLCAALLSTASAQHAHLNAGAFNTDPFAAGQGDQLFFANGSSFAASSGYIQSMPFSETGIYAGYFNSGPTITALPATLDTGGPSAYHPALGAFIELRLIAVTGPAGGTFSLWEADATSPTFSLQTGQTPVSILQWNLSDGNGSAGSDPFGHIHGRRFTADTGGVYTVTFQLFDTSTNGTGGGPIHTPSTTFQMNFGAVPEPASAILLVGSGVGFLFLRRPSASHR